jgi:beta-glucuronidase
MPSRRDFLSAIPALSAGAALAHGTEDVGASVRPLEEQCGEKLPLEWGWQFTFDPESPMSAATMEKRASDWQTVRVPHTWQTLGGNPDYVGTAWYRKEILVPEEWRTRFVRIEFEAVFHTAYVFLNGEQIGEHVGKGYTAFQCDLSPHLHFGKPNVLLVRVNNSFSDSMLPRMKSFDWTNDGGLIRTVQLLVTPPIFIERLEIDTATDLEAGTANVVVRAVIRNVLSKEQSVRLSGFLQREGIAGEQHQASEKKVQLLPGTAQTISLDSVSFSSPALWHFDAPHLYEAVIALEAGGEQNVFRDTFGIRRFEARGSEFYLNGERVRLMGVERMAGSHPEFGMVEPSEWIEANHRDMKELNCVFTRVHWPQDRRVLGYCDRNGILIQEEVPAWGPFTFAGVSADLQAKLVANGLEQLREMVASDRNHPCIVSWGLCNEVDGKNPNSRAFAHALAKEARATDPSRLLTYASHSLRAHPEEDMAGDFDFISANEYFGSWYPGGAQELREHVASLRLAFPNKPIVVSEFGWCECQASLPSGDENRVKIVEEHTNVMRDSGQVAGAIYFDFNDYRTIVGDKGTGALRQRVHGVVDVYSRRKTSFEALRWQASPVELFALRRTDDHFELEIVTRDRLPAYTLRDYSVRWLFYGYDDLPMEGKLDRLPVLKPGSRITLKSSSSEANLKRVVVDILRPAGFSALTTELVLD